MLAEVKFVGRAVDDSGVVHNLFYEGTNGKGSLFYVDELGVNIFSDITERFLPEDGGSTDADVHDLSISCDKIMSTAEGEDYNLVARIISEEPGVTYVAIRNSGVAVLLDEEGNEVKEQEGFHFADTIDECDEDSQDYIAFNDLF